MKEQYITVLFLQKFKMSTQVCTSCELDWLWKSLEKEGKTLGD